MKNSILLMLPVFCFSILNTFSQESKDFYVIDEGIGEMEFFDPPLLKESNVYEIRGFTPNALKQISTALSGMEIQDLHILVLTKPGAIIFNNLSVTPGNMDEWSTVIRGWARSVQHKVVIHSDVVFTTEEGGRLKQSLEEISQLEFIMQSLNQ